jgi:8-oxo-dGTP diphosphatase
MRHVVIGLVEQGGEFLSLRRTKGEEDGVLWGFPSGKAEPGETQRTAVIREVFEESGVLCLPRRKIGEKIVGGNLKLHYWKCAAVGGRPRAPATGETADVAFRSAEQTRRIIPAAAMHPCVRSALGIK